MPKTPPSGQKIIFENFDFFYFFFHFFGPRLVTKGGALGNFAKNLSFCSLSPPSEKFENRLKIKIGFTHAKLRGRDVIFRYFGHGLSYRPVNINFRRLYKFPV